MIDDLHRVGRKAFQDLCLAIAAEVLKRPIQSFLASNDGGRDGAFLGAWEGGEGFAAGKSTIQVKHFGNAAARLSLSHLAKELGKAKELAAQGLAGEYIVITTAGVWGAAEASICQAFEKSGVQRIQGGDRDDRYALYREDDRSEQSAQRNGVWRLDGDGQRRVRRACGNRSASGALRRIDRDVSHRVGMPRRTVHSLLYALS